MKYDKPYRPPVVTVDVVIFNTINDKLTVLLTKRANEPFKDEWSLPGGYSPADKTSLESLKEVSLRKAGVNIDDLKYIEQLYTFDSLGRDPRGHAISITYFGCGNELSLAKANQESEFVEINKIPKLAYDHQNIIKMAIKKISNQLSYTNIAASLLPDLFTFSQLQNIYQIILDQELDKRNFRKKILKQGILEETEKVWSDGAHRPAKMYSFKDKIVESHLY